MINRHVRPAGLQTRIFLDSGDPADTGTVLRILGFLDGQTTNPSYVAKSKPAQDRLKEEGKFSKEDLKDFYRQTAQGISRQIPRGSVSLEVYADMETAVERIVKEAREMNGWIPNAHIKLPIIPSGLQAAEILVKEGIRVNMTLCFSQEQAAAVHAATRGAVKGQVFISPFLGRLEDRGQNGLDLVANISRMYKAAESHVEILSASVRSLALFIDLLAMKAEIITAALPVLTAWFDAGMPTKAGSAKGSPSPLLPMAYHDLDLTRSMEAFEINHELTAAGLKKFAEDWLSLQK